jgi:hypothetical protein
MSVVPVYSPDCHFHSTLKNLQIFFSFLYSWPYLLTGKSCLFQGMIAGHVYYFLEDVYPRMTGRRPLKTPSFIKAMFADDNVVVARPANAGIGAGARFGAMDQQFQ